MTHGRAPSGFVVFLRGVNVGTHKRFRPSVLAGELADLGVVNVGAAGTFVVRGKIDQAALRKEFGHRLPFKTEVMICPGRELIDLVRRDPFGPTVPSKAVRRFLSVMEAAPPTRPPVPVARPAGAKWEVKVIAVSGRYALSLWRRLGRRVLYPNEVVETLFDVSATTRGWDTINTIYRILEAS